MVGIDTYDVEMEGLILRPPWSTIGRFVNSAKGENEANVELRVHDATQEAFFVLKKGLTIEKDEELFWFYTFE